MRRAPSFACSVALARLPEAADQALTLAEIQRANAVPLGVDLGSCVRVSLSGGWARPALTHEGVVIEVVPPGAPARSARIAHSRPAGSSRSSVVRYVVQCWSCRVLRRLVELEVVCR